MDYRARTHAPLLRAALLAALPVLLVPAVAGTTTAQARTKAPIVKRISPSHVYVGETLTIHGRHFRRGLNKNTVAFKRRGAKAVFVKAEKGTTKLLKVTLPKRLEKVLVVKNGTPTATRMNIRVLAFTFGKSFTSGAKSPIVSPERPPAPPKPPTADPNADCDADGIKNNVDADDDNDLLTDAQEKAISPLLNTCKADTDGDGIEDGYEYESAVDLNDNFGERGGSVTPYPRKLPFPNPLDGTDANTDHDGDSLTLKNEYDLWKYTIAHGTARTLHPLSYSAGKQYSLGKLPAATYNKQAQFKSWVTAHNMLHVSLVNLGNLTLLDPWGSVPDWVDDSAYASYDIRDFDRNGVVTSAEATYYDRNGNSVLDDGERDEDADGLPNQWEGTGCMTRALWNNLYGIESPYYLGNGDFGHVDIDDADSDGDGIIDGADDLDHDGIPNVMECSRFMASGLGVSDPRDDTSTHNDRPWKGMVNPYNPCLPHIRSRTCRTYLDVGPGAALWAPFPASEKKRYYYIWN